MAAHFYELYIANIEKETSNCVVISFAIPKNLQEIFTFIPGQYITLKTTINGKEERRSYSICSAPFEKKLSIAIKKVSYGVFSTYANEQLKVGDIINAMPPNGKFYTPLIATQKINYLFIASGSGITPIISILKTTLKTETESYCTLIYNNKTKNSVLFFEAIEALKNKYIDRLNVIHIFSREFTDVPLFYGRIDKTKLNALQILINYQKINEFFICGPEEMIHTSILFFKELGIVENKLHFELFGTAHKNKKEIKSKKNIINTRLKSKVTIKADGRSINFELEYDGINILDAALAQGVDLPYACKGGMCCTCKAKLIIGKINMDVNYALEKEEIAQGFILACQSHPTTEIVEVDFDIK